MSNYRNIDLDRYATIFKALSNPHRLHIFNILSGCCDSNTLCATDEIMSCCVGDLDHQLTIASSTLSHHLKELCHADLIKMQRNGKQVFCSIKPDTLNEVLTLFARVDTNRNREESHGS